MEQHDGKQCGARAPSPLYVGMMQLHGHRIGVLDGRKMGHWLVSGYGGSGVELGLEILEVFSYLGDSVTL